MEYSSMQIVLIFSLSVFCSNSFQESLQINNMTILSLYVSNKINLMQSEKLKLKIQSAEQYTERNQEDVTQGCTICKVTQGSRLSTNSIEKPELSP